MVVGSLNKVEKVLGMEINVSKTKIIMISRKLLPIHIEIYGAEVK